jgi:hypothetical protein
MNIQKEIEKVTQVTKFSRHGIHEIVELDTYGI